MVPVSRATLVHFHASPVSPPTAKPLASCNHIKGAQRTHKRATVLFTSYDLNMLTLGTKELQCVTEILSLKWRVRLWIFKGCLEWQTHTWSQFLCCRHLTPACHTDIKISPIERILLEFQPITTPRSSCPHFTGFLLGSCQWAHPTNSLRPQLNSCMLTPRF